MTRLNYGDDAEYDAWIEKQADPEWTGYDTDPSGSMADREQARWERQISERGTSNLILVLAATYIALGILALLADGTTRYMFLGGALWLGFVHLVCGMFHAAAGRQVQR